ncbi:MAG: translation initiation factor IF-2 [Bacteroidales bacterium]|nr:translation initiation factor IF-2 [Bacteroidales bacterium]MCF8404241.1 translation initiation factor IF-2 [Bacteroidales bacterium]
MALSDKPIRLSKAAREFNVGLTTIVEYLSKNGVEITSSPNTKLTPEIYALLEKEFQSQKSVKEEAKKIGLDYTDHQTISIDDEIAKQSEYDSEDEFDEVFIKDISLTKDEAKKTVAESKPEAKEEPKKEEKPSAPEKKEEEPVVEAPLKEIKETSKKEEEPSVEAVSPKEEIEVEKEKAQPEKIEEPIQEDEVEGQPRVLGKIDLEKINMKTKPRRKSTEEKKKEREEKRKATKDQSKALKPVAKKAVEEEKPKEKVVEKKEETKPVEPPKKEEEKPRDDNFIKTKFQKLQGPTIVDKIELPEVRKKQDKKPVASSSDNRVTGKNKKKRRRIQKTDKPVEQKKPEQQGNRWNKTTAKPGRGRKDHDRPEISEEDIQKQIKETLAKLTGGGKSKSVKYRKEKRQSISQAKQKELDKIELEKNIIKVTEFVTANELATMMNVQVNEVISTCMSLGMFVSINQRLDAETLSLVAEEFGYEVEFVSVDVVETIGDVEDAIDNEADLVPRAPVVTVMGHVDHGKTKLLDFIRSANVVAGEAGGITQHIGAYEVTLEGNKQITFLDTPGHEAFTAMRARGAKVTDVAIIVVAADDNVMPQTREAINHAQAAGVPIVFAINKIDKSGANPEKIKEELSKMNILVEDWGGKYQSQEISAKQGINISELLEKVLLEAELLDLKANPNKPAYGTVIESSLDKGRGYIAKLLVQDGTMKTGDVVIAGSTIGRVKAMYNERNQPITSAGPATPVLLLGLNGAPQAGDGFNVMVDEKEAKSIATKRQQLQREQGIRTQKHVTLDEIGRRIAIGDFKELNIIVKGDVDGSVEALSDSLLKLSNQQIQVNIIHKSVGQVTETDVNLASASDAIIVAFQVRPSLSARKLAEQEQIDIRLYSIIYQAIEEIKAAMEGMLSPEIEEKIVCNVEVREVYKITKVGTVAGCMVLDGVITRKTKVRIIRDGIVVYTGMLGSLKRFKDDAKEVKSGYECGLNIENFNDIKVGDIVEGYEEVEVKRKL